MVHQAPHTASDSTRAAKREQGLPGWESNPHDRRRGIQVVSALGRTEHRRETRSNVSTGGPHGGATRRGQSAEVQGEGTQRPNGD